MQTMENTQQAQAIKLYWIFKGMRKSLFPFFDNSYSIVLLHNISLGSCSSLELIVFLTYKVLQRRRSRWASAVWITIEIQKRIILHCTLLNKTATALRYDYYVKHWRTEQYHQSSSILGSDLLNRSQNSKSFHPNRLNQFCCLIGSFSVGRNCQSS